MEKYICGICGKEFSKIGLAKHYTKIHNYDRKKIYDLIHPDEKHICPVCGKQSSFDDHQSKYRTYCSLKCAKIDSWKSPERIKQLSNSMKSFWGDESKCSATRKHMQETWKNKTDEEKKLFHDKSSKSHKLVFKNKTPEELEKWRNNISKGQKLSFASYSEEQMNNLSRTRKLVWVSKSPKEQQEWISKIKSTWDSKTPEELEEFSRIQSSHWLSKTPEEQQEWISKIKSTWDSKTPEELEELSNKISSAWISKTNEEKLELLNKKRINKISLEQYEILYDKDKFKNYLIEYKDNNDNYPTPNILREKFNFSNSSGALNYIHQYELEDYILWGVSSPEQEVADYVKSIYKGEIIRNDRKILKGKELDIYLPDKHLAIEFNGCYWHSERFKDKYYHQNKSLDCLKNRINLIHIFDYKWDNDKDKIKAKIKYFISPQILNYNECKVEIKGNYLGFMYKDKLIQLIENNGDYLKRYIIDYNYYIKDFNKIFESFGGNPLMIDLNEGVDMNCVNENYTVLPPNRISTDYGEIYNAGFLLTSP